jgi:hypothetical protein
VVAVMTGQVPTFPTTVRAIMGDPAFALGVADVRAGRPPHLDYDLWETNRQWVYERGRAWGVLASRTIPLRRNGKITSEAVTSYMRFGDLIL